MAEIELHSQSAENFIIKVMYNRPATIVEISQSLQPTDFYFVAYRYLFTAIKKLSIEGDVTSEGIMTLLESKNKEGYEVLKNIGGASAIEQTFTDHSLPLSPSVGEQIKILKSFSYRRNAVNVGDRIKYAAESNLDSDKNVQFSDINELDKKVKELTYSLTESISTSEDVIKIGSRVKELKEKIKQGETSGINIGGKFPQLQRIFKGLRDGALYSMSAKEKVGKSTLLLDIAWHVAHDLKEPIGFADTELTDEENLLRLAAKVSHIPEDKIAKDDLTDEEREIVNKAWGIIEEVEFYYFNANHLSNNELESKVKLLQLNHGIRVFFYDYTKFFPEDVTSGRPDMVLASRVECLKESIAKSCMMPVLTAGQSVVMEGQQKATYPRLRFSETKAFNRLSDVIYEWHQSNPREAEHFGTHWLRLVMGRKTDQKLVGKVVFYEVDGDTQNIREL